MFNSDMPILIICKMKKGGFLYIIITIKMSHSFNVMCVTQGDSMCAQ